jgi:predicted GNAT superfamily acetyltransferase
MKRVIKRTEILASEDLNSMEEILELNNVFAKELSLLDMGQLTSLVDRSFQALQVKPKAAFLLAYDEESDHDSIHFLWFKSRYTNFAYVDRIAVNTDFQKQGLAAELYGEFFEAARAKGRNVVGCEVNHIPPNPVSMAFHEALGFKEIGKSEPNENGKVLVYLAKLLD